jgi:hypothetical protein
LASLVSQVPREVLLAVKTNCVLIPSKFQAKLFGCAIECHMKFNNLQMNAKGTLSGSINDFI